MPDDTFSNEDELLELTPGLLKLVGVSPEEFAGMNQKAQAGVRQAISDKLKTRAALDPNKGHKRINPYDMSGPDPSVNPVTGQMAPKLAGDRAKAIMVMGRIMGFIDKYSSKAVDKFGGAKAGPEKFIAQKSGEGQYGVGKSTPTQMGAAGDIRGGKRGNVLPMQQMMSKDKVKSLVEKLPMMPSSQMMFAVRMIGNYVWRIHATMRQELRDAAKQQLKGQGQAVTRQTFNPKTGEMLPDPKQRVDTESEPYKAKIAALSREFDEDSTNVKADLNMLASVAGVLKKSGGFGGQADKTFLEKVIQGYVDNSGQFHIKKVAVKPQEPSVQLPPELQKMSGYYGDEGERASDKGEPKVKAQGPVIRKKSASPPPPPADVSDEEADEFLKGISDAIIRPFDRYLNNILEVAGTDRKPRWWDEI